MFKTATHSKRPALFTVVRIDSFQLTETLFSQRMQHSINQKLVSTTPTSRRAAWQCEKSIKLW